MKAKAFAPGHISGFFEPIYNQDINRTGSRGAGINITFGSVSEVICESSTTQGIDVFINNKKSSAPVIRLALKYLIGENPLNVVVKTRLHAGKHPGHPTLHDAAGDAAEPGPLQVKLDELVLLQDRHPRLAGCGVDQDLVLHWPLPFRRRASSVSLGRFWLWPQSRRLRHWRADSGNCRVHNRRMAGRGQAGTAARQAGCSWTGSLANIPKRRLNSLTRTGTVSTVATSSPESPVKHPAARPARDTSPWTFPTPVRHTAAQCTDGNPAGSPGSDRQISLTGASWIGAARSTRHPAPPGAVTARANRCKRIPAGISPAWTGWLGKWPAAHRISPTGASARAHARR